MVNSLWTAATGMLSQQFHIDTISHNISNVNTTGYKRNRAEFQDLIYQTARVAGTPATEQTLVPVGLQIGHGVRSASSPKIFEEGIFEQTNLKTDLAVQGEGFFRITLPDGNYGYTRNGEFKLDRNRQLVTSEGYRLDPELNLPQNADVKTLKVREDGRVFVEVFGEDLPRDVGQVILFRFLNPAGLDAEGNNYFSETVASGESISFQPGTEGIGVLRQGFLERSNVNLITEFVNMIKAQRAYEFNSKAIQTSDTMLGVAVGLKR